MQSISQIIAASFRLGFGKKKPNDRTFYLQNFSNSNISTHILPCSNFSAFVCLDQMYITKTVGKEEITTFRSANCRNRSWTSQIWRSRPSRIASTPTRQRLIETSLYPKMPIQVSNRQLDARLNFPMGINQSISACVGSCERDNLFSTIAANYLQTSARHSARQAWTNTVGYSQIFQFKFETVLADMRLHQIRVFNFN